jgi:hypothetical protein
MSTYAARSSRRVYGSTLYVVVAAGEMERRDRPTAPSMFRRLGAGYVYVPAWHTTRPAPVQMLSLMLNGRFTSLRTDWEKFMA